MSCQNQKVNRFDMIISKCPNHANRLLCEFGIQKWGTHRHPPPPSRALQTLRDWSLITGRGGYKMGKSRVRNLLRPPPPPQDRVKLFAPPLLKSGNFSRPPYNMAKTSSFRIKTTPKLFVPPPPFSMAKTFSAPPFCRRKTSSAPPSRFVAPPPRY